MGWGLRRLLSPSGKFNATTLLTVCEIQGIATADALTGTRNLPYPLRNMLRVCMRQKLDSSGICTPVELERIPEGITF